jgi:tripartite-type tricarboxylate transporter receptor subunit TctC
MDRRTFLASIAASAALAAQAQEPLQLPDGTLNILVGFPAGSSVDALARSIADHARNALGRPVLVLNQPGATGMISLGQLRRAPADGTAIGLVPVTSGLVAPMFRSKPDFNLVADFEPVVMVGHYALAFSVATRLGVEDWKGFLQWARSHPNELFYGHGGTGGMAHLVGALVAGATGLKLQDVPFKSDAESLMSVLGGQTQTALSSTVAVHPHYKAAKVRTLAVTSRERVAQMPEVPTLVELGYPAAVAEPWMALFAPRGTPARAIGVWNRIVNTALADAAFRQSLGNQGYVVAGGTPDALRATVAADAARYRKVMDGAGLKPID